MSFQGVREFGLARTCVRQAESCGADGGSTYFCKLPLSTCYRLRLSLGLGTLSTPTSSRHPSIDRPCEEDRRRRISITRRVYWIRSSGTACPPSTPGSTRRGRQNHDGVGRDHVAAGATPSRGSISELSLAFAAVTTGSLGVFSRGWAPRPRPIALETEPLRDASRG